MKNYYYICFGWGSYTFLRLGLTDKTWREWETTRLFGFIYFVKIKA